ncbi:MAG: RloB family protein [Bacteroidia bacterium]|nr:RloB family protein [Bacteroidia bacterium]
MIEPWNIKPKDLRQADTRPTFIIFCEDKETEPEYFNAFSSDNISISTIRNCGQHHKQIDFATEYCRKNDLLEIIDEKEKLKIDDGAQVWCVFDRDREPDDGKDSSFSNSIDNAILKGFKIAWSNDNFELWILLHFEKVDPSDASYNHRRKYYERLTQILKTLLPLNQDEERITRNPVFHYDDFMKKRKRFLPITFQHMKGKQEIAIANSKILEIYHSAIPKPHHEKSPCTLVHHLVEELIRAGGRKI